MAGEPGLQAHRRQGTQYSGDASGALVYVAVHVEDFEDSVSRHDRVVNSGRQAGASFRGFVARQSSRCWLILPESESFCRPRLSEEGMKDCRHFYIDGKWVEPVVHHDRPIINPATERPIGMVSLASAADVDKAVAAAKGAFPSYAETTIPERIALLQRVIQIYRSKMSELAESISLEMGCPISLSRAAQAPVGLGHLIEIVRVLTTFRFEELRGKTLIRKEPIGVCGLITPWNWPMNQIVCKVAPALAAGCTVVLKPSETAPLSASVFAQIIDEAGLPPGVFNMIHGDGPSVGSAICSHSDVDMVSFAGSTRGGVAVALAAAPTVKRVTQELGGKSANIILEDASLPDAVSGGCECMLPQHWPVV